MAAPCALYEQIIEISLTNVDRTALQKCAASVQELIDTPGDLIRSKVEVSKRKAPCLPFFASVILTESVITLTEYDDPLSAKSR